MNRSSREWLLNAVSGLCMHAKWLLLCPTLCDPMDYTLPASSVYGILQVGILEWVAMPPSKGSSPHRDRIHVSCISRRVLYD